MSRFSPRCWIVSGVPALDFADRGQLHADFEVLRYERLGTVQYLEKEGKKCWVEVSEVSMCHSFGDYCI